MIKPILITGALCVALTGCARLSESRLNPLNWFGPSTSSPASAPVDASGELRPLIPDNRRVIQVDGRDLIASVTALSIDRSPSGAIVRATGLAPTQGYFNAELVPIAQEGGVLTLAFRAQAPAGFEAVGAPATREITAAYVIDAGALPGIRTVRVEASANARTARR